MSTSIVFDILARDRASSKFAQFGRSVDSSSGKLKKFALVGGAALGATAVIAGKALFDMTKAAIEDEKAQALLAKTLKNSAGATNKQVGAIESWISAQGEALGVTDDELRPALQRLTEATGDVGKAQKLSSLAMNISAGTGKSLKTVSEALAKAQMGQVGGLSRYGIATRDASGAMMTFDEVTKKATKTFGGQAATAANTTEGKFKRLKVMFDETKESIGAKLIPVAGKLADWFLTKVVPAAQKLGDWLRTKLGPPLKDLAEKVGPMATQIMGALKDAFQDAKPGIELAGKILANVVVPGLKKLMDVAGPALVAQIRGMGKMLEFVGKAGTWMWNNALQPAFKFLIKGIAVVADGFAAMLGAMGKVPGFGWAKDAAVAMGKAADKANAVADGLKKIPPKKTVYVSVKYTYSGLRNGTGSTRGGDPNDPASYLPRMAQTAKPLGQRVMEAIADGMKSGGKKIDEVLGASRDRIKASLSQIRGDMKSLSESIASALNPTDFGGGLAELMASLTGNNGALTGLTAVFAQLKDSVSKGFLSSLMQSGNVGLATSLANDPAAAAQASALFDQNAALAQGLGDQTAQAVLGDKIEKALQEELGKVREKLNDLPGKQAKQIRKELEGLRLELVGMQRNGGQGAHVRGAW